MCVIDSVVCSDCLELFVVHVFYTVTIDIQHTMQVCVNYMYVHSMYIVW